MASTRELTDVQFSTMYRTDNPHHVIAVAGSTSYLGRWDTAKAVYLKERGKSAQWIGTVKLPVNKCMEWKLVLVDTRTKRGVRWEEENNRLLCIKSANPTNIVVPWNHTGIVVSLEDHVDVITRPSMSRGRRAKSPDEITFTPERLTPSKDLKDVKYVNVGVAKPFEKQSPNKDSPGDVNSHGGSIDTVTRHPINLSPVTSTTSDTDSDSDTSRRIPKQRVIGTKRKSNIDRYGSFMMLGGSLAVTFIAAIVYFTLKR